MVKTKISCFVEIKTFRGKTLALEKITYKILTIRKNLASCFRLGEVLILR